MTCTQRNFLVFMTSAFVLFLQIQTYSVNSHQHPHQQNRHYNHQQQQQYNHQRRLNDSSPFGQYDHLRHQHHHHHHPHSQHHSSIKNKEQVQQQLHFYQHHQNIKTSDATANKNHAAATPFTRSDDEITAPSSSSFLNSHHSPSYYKTSSRVKNQKLNYSQNFFSSHNNVGGNSSHSSISSSNNVVVNNHHNNNNNNNIDQTLKTHHQSNNSFGGRYNKNNNNHDEHNVQHKKRQQQQQNHPHQYTVWNRNSLFHQFDGDMPKEEGYQRKSSGSKVHSDRLHQYPMNASRILRVTSSTLKPATTTTRSPMKATATQKNWELQRKNFSQLSKSILMKGIGGGSNDENNHPPPDTFVELEDYYEDDDDDNDDADDMNDNDNDEENQDDDTNRNNPLRSFESKYINSVSVASTAKSIKDQDHSDFTYDYLYDEPTNDTDEKPGSLTEEKWRNYGTAEAVEKSRRRHLSEAQIIAAHITRINLEAMCKYPRPKIIQINEASKRYVPHCTVLHRCGDDTGCCHSETQTCVAKKTVTVDLHFYAIPLTTKDPIIEVLSFVNHTECHCVDRFSKRVSTYTAPDNNLLDDKNMKNGSMCNCIRHFDIFEENIDDETDYQQSDSLKHHSNCRCDCTTDNFTCQRLKRGQEGISVVDRRCITEGRCIPPTCEYGIYDQNLGRCPRAIVKRTINDGT